MKFYNYKMKSFLNEKVSLKNPTNQNLLLHKKYLISSDLDVNCHLQIFEDHQLLTCKELERIENYSVSLVRNLSYV